MKVFQNMSIRRKQMLIIILTSNVALLLACAAFVVYDISVFRRELVERTMMLAEVIGNNCVAAIDFNDPKSAQEALGVLRGEPGIISACIYDARGEVFTTYSRKDSGEFHPSVVQKEGAEFKDKSLRLFKPVGIGTSISGTVFIESDLSKLKEHLARYPAIVGLMFGVSLVVAFLLSSRLHRVVSDPIMHLAQTTRIVARDKNYSVRATKQHNDEVGELIEGFNEMLVQIEHRETALRMARDLMEQRVEERTEDLARSLSLLNATIESTADGILAVDLSGRVASYNKKFVFMWKIPVELLMEGKNEQIVGYMASQMRDPDKYLARMKELSVTPEIEVVDVLELNDGRFFERYVQPQRIENQCVGYVFNFRDITQRRKAEEDMESVHAELVLISRRAGMAEVATNVLHNVGNVLNSVNTSAGLVMDHVRASSHTGVARVASLLEEHQHNLADFLSQKGTVERIINYLKTLSSHLETEQNKVAGELRELVTNIEHIKEIVAMQQSYARVSGVLEMQSIGTLLEDALRIHASALSKQQVRVVRKFDPVPEIMVDKHKILQIFVNLISNAKYALADANTEKLVILKVTSNGDNTIRASVTDNGMGIEPDNLARIFSHGFTTRKNGHGFGLHSGALAAREMGGALLVHSDGLGKGATFTLELPVHKKNEAS